MDDLVKLCRERAAGYGALRRSCLTAIALDRSADRIEQLQRQLAEAVANERRKCREECERAWYPDPPNDDFLRGYSAAKDDIAANIRERTD
ncbi:MAG: hypothetical protein E6Q97_06255 [Desulfurellales bacterium]|nr:MAG: hypothetical protein E6Q97_06255 [Desulfurellales bacterium]